MRRLAPALSSWNKEYGQNPIAYIIFNRPRHTRETFAAIRAQQPAKLFIIADGPRPGHSTDEERCREVREIVEQIDWPCEVYRNYADSNLGLKRRVSSGLDWVFEKVDRVIVLEDDCLSHPDFFGFCEASLKWYENDLAILFVGMIVRRKYLRKKGQTVLELGQIRQLLYLFDFFTHLTLIMSTLQKICRLIKREET